MGRGRQARLPGHRPEKLEATIRTAFEIARTGRPGPVVIDMPKDVQNWSGTFRGEGLLPVPGYRQRLHASRDNVLGEAESRSSSACCRLRSGR
jgi:acetolactate synthase I/II/III large subunit